MKTILFDFDGVIVDSNSVREKGFIECLSDYPKKHIDKLLDFHNKNGGLSRYVKFDFFYSNILKQKKDGNKIDLHLKRFNDIMLTELTNEKYLINDTLDFIKKNSTKYKMHIVSGSDQCELIEICNRLKIDIYFKSINGSPRNKFEIIKDLIDKNSLNIKTSILIGDSINDFEAAKKYEIKFYGFNNLTLEKLDEYIYSFKEFNI